MTKTTALRTCIIVCLLLSVQLGFAAVSYTGSLSTDGTDPGLTGVPNSSWAMGVSVSWLVTWVASESMWQYYYTLDVSSLLLLRLGTGENAVSHVLIETSDSFDPDRIADGSVKQSFTPSTEAPPGMSYADWITGDDVAWDPTTAESGDWTATGGKGNSNPQMPDPLHGLKFAPETDTTAYSLTFMTDANPVWGDFYAKDGKTWVDGDEVDNAVWNAGFTSGDWDPLVGAHDGSEAYHILRPDTEGGGGPPPSVPELPPVLLLSLVLMALTMVKCLKRS